MAKRRRRPSSSSSSSLSRCHTHTHTATHAQTHSTLPLSLHTHARTHARTNSPSLSLQANGEAKTKTIFVFVSLSLSHAHSNTRTNTLTLTHTHTHRPQNPTDPRHREPLDHLRRRSTAKRPTVTVMLFGHNDQFVADKAMKVTVAFNHFGPGLVQRMPRVRLGYAHVANNRYDEWGMYAIGGSSNPTIFSEGNYFVASKRPDIKQVTKREVNGGWKDWKWRSSKDKFMNGAYFVPSGWGDCAPLYSRSQSFTVAEGSMVPSLTSDAGPLRCPINNKPC